MTRLEFYDACSAVLVSPFIALENEQIKEALRQRDDEKVIELLKTEF